MAHGGLSFSSWVDAFWPWTVGALVGWVIIMATKLSGLWKDYEAEFGPMPKGAFWVPARMGGGAPTLEEAEREDKAVESERMASLSASPLTACAEGDSGAALTIGSPASPPVRRASAIWTGSARVSEGASRIDMVPA